MKHTITVGIAMLSVLVFLLTACTDGASSPGTGPAPVADQNIEPATPEKPIGGERDEHGCLGPAGYSWDRDINACIRAWELDESQRKAAKIAVSPLSYYVTVVEVETLRCPGCFIIRLQRNDNQQISEMRLDDWKISA